MFFSVKKKKRHYMERKNLIELSEMQRYKEENKNYQKENERLREFSLELFKEGFKLGFKKGYSEAIEKVGKD
jgi:flagellar biosynthesis/type III secretory pathway protein FliH